MSLSPGARIAHYDVTALIGEGGMGQVWQATDTQLNRQVALKILPDAFAGDAERLARFQREAQVLARLNHPNIAAIHGIEEDESEGTHALVLELVVGPTLADRIAHGAIPIDDALPIATQIAEALEAAHEAGVIHRDLKPANIKVRDDGTVKVLDFGLAKALGPPASDTNLSASPTISMTAAATQIGMVMGTAAYMSPEQAKGKAVDRRADVWAFGAVLFEMLTGRKPFAGDDVSEMLVSVIRDDPDWSWLPADTPPGVNQALRVCLQKDTSQRVRDMSAIRMALGGAFTMPVEAGPESAVAPSPATWQRPIPATIFALMLTGVAAGAAWTLARPAVVPGDVIRFEIVTSDTAPMLHFGANPDLAISPDGTRVVYNGGAIGAGAVLALGGVAPEVSQLQVRSFDQATDAPFAGVSGVGPFFSPDGEWIGFVDQSGTTLQRVSVLGGPPVIVAETFAPIMGASWGASDQIIFSEGGLGLFSVARDAGEPQQLTAPDRELGEAVHGWPSFVADRDAVLFVIGAGIGPTGEIAVLDLGTGDVTRLGLRGTGPHYVSTQHLVYAAEDASIRAVAFDIGTLRVTGSPFPMIDGVMVKNEGAANFSISDHGRLVYVPGAPASLTAVLSTLALVNHSGGATPFTEEEREYFRPRMSPDGTRVAVEVTERRGAEPVTHVWIVDVDTGTATQLTFAGSRNQFPVWTRDGETVVFRSDRANDDGDIYRKAADGAGEATLVLDGDGAVTPTDVSRDGVLLFQASTPDAAADILTMPLDGGEPPTEFLSTPDQERAARFSPDGRWVAYQVDDGSGPQVYVRPYPRTEGSQRRVSEDAGRAPIWSPAGQSLFFAGLFPVPLYVASVETDPDFVRGRPEELFVLMQQGLQIGRQIMNGPIWDVAPDGERFVMVLPNSGAAANGSLPERVINVVLNWDQELLERVPIPCSS